MSSPADASQRRAAKKANRALVFRPDRPFNAVCAVPRTVREPDAFAPWWRLVAAVVRRIPAHGSSRTALQKGRLVKLAIAASGAVVALRWPTPLGFGAGAALAACAAGLPAPIHKRRLWVRRAQERAEGREQLTWVDASLQFDGTKLSIRVEGKVWRSGRQSGEHDVVCGRLDDRVLLGWVHKNRGAAKSIWLLREGPGAPDLPPLEGDLSAGADSPVRLDAAAWDTLRAAVFGLTVPEAATAAVAATK